MGTVLNNAFIDHTGGFSGVNDLLEAEDRRFKEDIGFFKLRWAVKQEVDEDKEGDEDKPPSNDVVILEESEANEPQWKDPVTAPVYVNKLGECQQSSSRDSSEEIVTFE